MDDIVLSGVSKAYGEKRVLERLSLRFPAGRVSGVMAPSGAGKTTLLRLLMGLEKPDTGRIDGLNGYRVAVQFQENRLLERLSAQANIRLMTPRLTRAEATAAMARFGLTDCADQPAQPLSGGMKRRVALLRALLADWDLLLLDEPFNGLDEDTRAQVIQVTRELIAGRTVILVTHDPEEVRELADVLVHLPMPAVP